MVRTSSIIALLATASTVFAADVIPSCAHGNPCPEATPCCSQYGQCGVGAYCLGGCDVMSSFSPESCVPAPVCKSQTYNFNSMDRITAKDKYLGDASKTDWVMDGQALPFDGNVLLTMSQGSVGTVLSSSTYMWYGNVKAKFKTSRGNGVVTAFILFSDVKDEIDYEFVGADLKTAQTNYYHQGVTNYANGGNITLSDTFNNFHTYEIDWTPETITWSIDGQVGRVQKKSDTWNATANQWYYPQTPARVQLSLWPGGLETNAKGTVDWAGGYINWDSQDIKDNNYYYSVFESVEVQCYDAKTAPGTNKGVSYTYSSALGTNDTIVDGNKPTVLKSLEGTGTDMNKGDPALLASGTTTGKPKKTAQSVPGLVGGGTGELPHSDGSAAAGAPAGGSSGGSSGGDSSATEAAAPGTTGFNQGSSSATTPNGGDKLGSQERIVKGSVFAGVIAVVAMMAL